MMKMGDWYNEVRSTVLTPINGGSRALRRNAVGANTLREVVKVAASAASAASVILGIASGSTLAAENFFFPDTPSAEFQHGGRPSVLGSWRADETPELLNLAEEALARLALEPEVAAVAWADRMARILIDSTE